MPFVHVKILRGAPTEPKARIGAEMTTTLQTVLGKRPEHTHIVIDEVDAENWGFAGMLTTEWLRQQARESRAGEPESEDRRRHQPGA